MYSPYPQTNLESYQKQASDLVAQIGRLQQYQAPPVQPPVLVPSIQYVNGMDGAKAYQREMPANGKAILMDSNEDVFFVVAKDANGVTAPITIGHFTLEQEKEPEVPQYITKKDFDDFRDELMEMLNRKGNGA